MESKFQEINNRLVAVRAKLEQLQRTKDAAFKEFSEISSKLSAMGVDVNNIDKVIEDKEKELLDDEGLLFKSIEILEAEATKVEKLILGD